MSFDIAISIFRKFSAWASSRLWNSIFASLVSPPTRSPISSPNCVRMSASVAKVSSTVSCRRPAATVTGSRRISARISATASGWVR